MFTFVFLYFAAKYPYRLDCIEAFIAFSMFIDIGIIIMLSVKH